MTRLSRLVLAMILSGVTAGLASADPAAEVKARHDYFDGLSAEMKKLGAIAKSFDPAAAKAEAANLNTILSTDFRTLFPAGTSADDVKDSRAKPAIWANFDDFLAHEKALKDAGAAVVAAADAGDGTALGAGLGKMGAACKACHDTYRAAD